MKIVLTSPNNWCLAHYLTENKIYTVISNPSAFPKSPPHFIVKNDLGYETEVPIHCFDLLKNVRIMKLKKLKIMNES